VTSRSTFLGYVAPRRVSTGRSVNRRPNEGVATERPVDYHVVSAYHRKMPTQVEETSGGEPLLLEVVDHVARLTLNRPEKLNAINERMLQLLEQYVIRIEANDDVRAVIVQGRGKAFCAGADLEEITGCLKSSSSFAAWLDEWHRVFALVERCAKPTVAAVHGLALAGGLELTQVCDVVVASEDAQFGDQHAKLGLFPGGGSTQRLPRLIGQRRARWMLLSGEAISAGDARNYGMVNWVVRPRELTDAALRFAAQLARLSVGANASIKRAAIEGADLQLDAGLRLEREIAVAHMVGPDPQIGLRSFRERSIPLFTGLDNT
jgi:enoyl-CoA hydratase/carnithine racemase